MPRRKSIVRVEFGMDTHRRRGHSRPDRSICRAVVRTVYVERALLRLGRVPGPAQGRIGPLWQGARGRQRPGAARLGHGFCVRAVGRGRVRCE